MHHLIYPAKDTFITNRSGYQNKNFGIDELLQVGTVNKTIQYLSPTKNYIYVDEIFNSQHADYFTGIFTGSFGGTVDFTSGSITGSLLEFTASYFSGAIDGVSQEINGIVSGGIIDGFITGSVISPYVIGLFTGQLTGAAACLTGTGSGTEAKNEPNRTTITTKFVDRALLAFDLTAISTSIANGTIISASFALKIKVCNEYQLPITYAMYALPVSQSWNMGDGYSSDGGSDNGVSWEYTDNNYGTQWWVPYTASARPSIDFINNLSNASASFSYGGGTWYTSSIASQSFNYQSADINMDITDMVNGWLNNSVPNEGLLLVHSDELQSTGSGVLLTFFSKDTNTIYSPYLDVKWDDSIFSTGSFSTGSVKIATASAGINATVESGSTFSITGGISGSFSASTALLMFAHYITASNQVFAVSQPQSVVWFDPTGYFGWFGEYGYQNPYDVIGWGEFALPVPPSLPIMGDQHTRLFTGSFSGSFSGTASYVNGTISGNSSVDFIADYFSGSVDGTIIEENYSEITGSLIDGIVSGSIATLPYLGLYVGALTSSAILLNGTGSGYYLDPLNYYFNGFVDGMGLTGNIRDIPVYGVVTGVMAVTQSLVNAPCGNTFLAQIATATFINGPFSGSSFVAYYVDYKFENAVLFGNWTNDALLGSQVYIPLPSGIDPYAYAYVAGIFISGKALGLYTISSSISGSTSASFNGQFIDGNLLGGYLNLQLSGSVYTSSFIYTSSVEISASYFNPLDVERPFSIVLQGLKPTYKAGDIAKIGVFGRKQYPLKYFGISSQQEQYIVPEFLPSSSFYGLKDNLTDEIILNFDEFTKISCNYPYGNYFILDTTCLPQERYYNVLIQIQDSSTTYTIDTGKTFKIVR